MSEAICDCCQEAFFVAVDDKRGAFLCDECADNCIEAFEIFATLALEDSIET